MDERESARVLGVGVGLFLIILIWALAVAGLTFLTRLKTGPSVGILSAAILLTIILLVIPRKVSVVSTHYPHPAWSLVVYHWTGLFAGQVVVGGGGGGGGHRAQSPH